MGNKTRNNNLFVPMDYFSKLMCGVVAPDKLIWGQKLVFPRKYNNITAGFKDESPGYWLSKGDRSWSSTHYGTDFGKSDGLGGLDTNLYALGVGTVIRRVWNHDMGNILQVLYENVLMPDNSKKDIVALYAHLERPSDFVEGSSVYISETLIAVIGGTGEYGGGVVNSHLHLELADYNVTVDHDR